MPEVEVIKANEGIINRKIIQAGSLRIQRARVAAYIRVSTDDEEQLQSFQSQKQYYDEKIAKNSDWVLVGIYADEGITGTKTIKRDGFLSMIDDCMNEKIDIILTKSISRFSRNLVDTLQYVRLLKEKGIAVIFEKENINTLSMESEMALALLSTLAQNEVESLSANVKLGIKMKMKRGELMGFNGCLGYDYHKEDKSITVNPEEAETVRLIFDLYLQGYGAHTIVKELTRLEKKNKKGVVQWSDTGVRLIIQNEKYKGDLLLGKTITTDPISKRRLKNMGEEEMYYIRDHHEAIVSKDIWEKANEIRKTRYQKNGTLVDGTRVKASRKYAFSGMCECGFCGGYYTRRSHHQDTQHKKPVWKCSTSTKKGIAHCMNSRAIDEVVIENAFVDAFQLLVDNFDDVIESVLKTTEEVLSTDKSEAKVKRMKTKLSKLEERRSKLTDMLLDGTILEEDYVVKNNELIMKINQLKGEELIYTSNIDTKRKVSDRLKEIRLVLEGTKTLESFDRSVFECLVKKIIIGGVEEDGSIDPYKLTFVLRGMDNHFVPDAKERYRKLN